MIAVFLALLIMLPVCVHAQKANFEFYTTAEGLSGNLTHGAAQDRQGFLWILNDYKLHRFDGRSFVLYTLPKELPGSNAGLEGPFLYEDSLLFLFSKTHGILMNPETGVWESFPGPFEKGEKKQLGAINNFKNGDPALLVYSENEDTVSLWRFHNRRFETLNITNLFPARGKYFVIGPDNELLVSSSFYETGLTTTARNTIEIYDLESGNKSEIQLPTLPPDGYIRYIYPDKNGLITILTSENLYDGLKYRIHTVRDFSETPAPHPVNRILKKTSIEAGAILPAKDGSLWLTGTDADRRLYFYNALQDTLYDFTPNLKSLIPNVNQIIYPFIDKTGTVWVMTRLGLLKVTLQEAAFRQFFSQSAELCGGDCSIRGFAEDRQGNIFASFYHGIARFDPKRENPSAVFSPKTVPMPLPSGLFADDNGLWLNNGQLMDAQSGRIGNIQGSKAMSSEEGLFALWKDGRLWWVYEHELFYLDNRNGQLQWTKVLELPYKGAYMTEAIHAGQSSRNLWISHKGRLLQYAPPDKKQTWFDPTDWGLPVNRILAIEEDRDGMIWLATDIGLVRFNPGVESGQTPARLYTTKDGLPNNFICGMLAEGDSCLWLSTNHGLSRFHIAGESFVNFFEEDGLTHNEFNRRSYFKAGDGRMYFGGLRGINAFYPDQLMNNLRRGNEAAKVVLSSFEFTDERQDTVIRIYDFAVAPEIHLYHWQRSFTFEFAFTDFHNPLEVAYSYQMEGYENAWSTPSKFNFTRFSSLPPGKYVFRVKARDSHGMWRQNELAVRVVVHPPWWAAWWAYLIYAAVFGGLLYFIRKSEINRQTLKTDLALEKLEADKLKELDSFKTRLYTNLTHEFRTPLTVILGMNDQIKNDPGKYLSQGTRLIETNGKNLLNLINQLLDLSKLENKSFRLKPEHGDIVPYLRYVTESFQTFANSKNLSLRFLTTLESLEVDFDPEQIKQVMTNLISNALKFTPSGGEVKVRLSVDGERPIGDTPSTVHRPPSIVISVSDTGIGIPEKDLPHVFDRFYQVDSSPTRQNEGTGIGLAHTLELVKLMGGMISVESKPGKGTTFTVNLPAALAREEEVVETFVLPPEVPEPLVPSPEPGITGDPALDSDGKKLLIIEDNPDVVIYLRTCLEELYRLDVAYNGKIGIEKALETIPDLIISDVMMPEKDGFEVCDTLKNDERTSHIPIILLTAKVDAASRIAGLRRGADAYLAKPFDKEELLVQLENLAEIRRRLRERYAGGASEPGSPQPGHPAVFELEDAFIQKVRQIVEVHFSDEDFGLPRLCLKIGMSRSQLFRKMKALIDVSPSDFIRNHRLNEARRLLESTDLNVSEVAWKVGYKYLSHFSNSYQEFFGEPPSATNK